MRNAVAATLLLLLSLAGATPQVIEIGPGSQHTLMIDSEGVVHSVGLNRYGQLGDGTTMNRLTFDAVDLPTRAVGVAASFHDSVALLEDGSVWVWGGSTSMGGPRSTVPVQVEAPDAIVDVAVGGNTVWALDGPGNVWILGSDSPRRYRGLPGPASRLSASSSHVMALVDGVVWTLGAEGNPPTRVEGLDDAAEIAAGHGFSIALRGDGTVVAWGGNQYGQLGSSGGRGSSGVPVTVPELPPVQQIAAGVSHGIAMARDGSVWVWGGIYETDGVLPRRGVEQVHVDGEVWFVAAGGGASYIVMRDGSYWAWGHNHMGQLGDGTRSTRFSPFHSSGRRFVTRVSAGGHHTLALANTGEVFAWGAGDEGQLGVPGGVPKGRVAPIPGLADVVQVSAGGQHSLAVLVDGSVFAWGANLDGQLGTGSTASSPSPQLVDGIPPAVSVSAGHEHSLALDTSGGVWAWGRNDTGELGRPEPFFSSVPLLVPGLADVKGISAGHSHSLVVTRDGSVWAWGANDHGQLGDGSTTTHRTPVRVPVPVVVEQVSAGNGFSLAVAHDGSLWAWGDGSRAQLGRGSSSSFEPVHVLAPESPRFVAVSAGGDHALAVSDDGRVWGWGVNGNSQLGENWAETPVGWFPAQIAFMAKADAVDAGYWHSTALRAGVVWAWGRNQEGQLAHGESSAFWGPVQVSLPH